MKPCPHLAGDKCAFPDWLLNGKPYLFCQAVREIHMGCAMKDKKEKGDDLPSANYQDSTITEGC